MNPDISIVKASQITGWMSTEELNWLAKQAMRSEFIIEYGCYMGRSTRALADNTYGIVFAVDPWDGNYKNDDGSASSINTDIMDDFTHNLQDHINSGRVVIVKDYSWAYKPSTQADFIFIDGDHREDCVKDDIMTAMRYIKSGGILAGHDYGRADWPGVKRAVDDIFVTPKVVDTIWWVEIR